MDRYNLDRVCEEWVGPFIVLELVAFGIAVAGEGTWWGTAAMSLALLPLAAGFLFCFTAPVWCLLLILAKKLTVLVLPALTRWVKESK